jgi:hypothetical protein
MQVGFLRCLRRISDSKGSRSVKRRCGCPLPGWHVSGSDSASGRAGWQPAYLNSGGIAACSRWWRVVCDTTGNRTQSSAPGKVAASWSCHQQRDSMVSWYPSGVQILSQTPLSWCEFGRAAVQLDQQLSLDHVEKIVVIVCFWHGLQQGSFARGASGTPSQ